MVENQGFNVISSSDMPYGTNYSVKSGNSLSAKEEYLDERLDSIMADQGIFSKAWNGVKETLNLGTSAERCEDYIEKYKKGEISFEEAAEEIDKFDSKQDSSLNLFSNIATSIGAIAAATAAAAAVIATGGILAPVVAAGIAGAGAGAVTKASFKFADRATNEVKGDALDSNQIARDALSGAVTGAIAGATMGNGTTAATLKESVVRSATSAAKTGVITGTVAGSSNYIIDCAFDEDKDFDAKEFVSTTAENAVFGGLVGGIVGTTNGALRSCGVIKHGGMVKGTSGAIQNATGKAIGANAFCSAETKIGIDSAKNAAKNVAKSIHT